MGRMDFHSLGNLHTVKRENKLEIRLVYVNSEHAGEARD